MQKTRLGISVGLMGTITYFVCYFGGYVAALLVFGYILLVENNQWLRKTAVKALVLTIAFSLLPTAIELIPDILRIVGNVVLAFDGSFSVPIVSEISSILLSIVEFGRTILFILLGIKAFTQGSVTIPIVDDVTNKNTD